MMTNNLKKPSTISGKNSKLNSSTNMYYYLMLVPGIIFFLVFCYYPMTGIIVAFKDYNALDGIYGSPWADDIFKWFKQAFSNGDFSRVVSNTLIISLMKIAVNFPAPIILALLLNEVGNKYFKKTVQTVIYLPHFINWVIIGGILTSLLSSSTEILSIFGIKTSPLSDPDSFRWVLVLSQVWKEAGWGTVIYLAAISSIEVDMYEAAVIDGANRFEQAIYITIPAIASTIAVLLILRTGSILSAGFDQIFVLSSPIVRDVSDVIDTYVYRVGVGSGKFSLAQAIGLFQSGVGLVLIVTTNWIVKRMGQRGLW